MKRTKTVDELVESGDIAGVSSEQLEKINRLTRRNLEAEQVFTFSVILCDNEIDRDCERFPKSSLVKLGQLFMGKTGVFDHSIKAANQSARIFDTQVVREEGMRNSLGEEYVCLKAWAYMVRCEKNADLILEIDGGIKKEVSVGCAVEDIVCSVCGASQKSGGCEHEKGREYAGAICHHLLMDPTDAYEWSFVAVPAQKNAGVVKRYRKAAFAPPPMALEKWLSLLVEEDLYVSREQHRQLAKEISVLKEMAQTGKSYMDILRRQVVKLALLSQKEMDPVMLEAVVGRMNVQELRAFEKAFSSTARERIPMSPQTAGFSSPKADLDGHGMSAFQVK